jgi:hypothetical protein
MNISVTKSGDSLQCDSFTTGLNYIALLVSRSFSRVTGALLVVSVGGLGANSAVAESVTATKLSAATAAVSAEAKPDPEKKKFKTCAALHKVFKHGVGKKGAKDAVKGRAEPVKSFTVSNASFALNKKLDKDDDGIACEKK